MNQIKIYLPGTIVLAGLLPAVGAAVAGEWRLLVFYLLLTAVWLLLLWGERVEKTAAYLPADYANYLLVLIALLLVNGAWLDVAAGWLLGGILFALAAWDLDAFYRRLGRASRIEQETQVVQNHLRRLLTALGLGLALSAAALLLQYELHFGWAILLVLLLMFAFGRVIATLRQNAVE
jgi:hypothetical protein